MLIRILLIAMTMLLSACVMDERGSWRIAGPSTICEPGFDLVIREGRYVCERLKRK